MHGELRKLPVETVNSRANFILIKVGKNANKLIKYLMTNSIIVRKMTKEWNINEKSKLLVI